ncbi:unnamed protein product [Boreogadus saida]
MEVNSQPRPEAKTTTKHSARRSTSYPRQTFQFPEDTRRSSQKASAAVQLPEYTAGAAGLPDCRRSFGHSRSGAGS